jgi:hypothetical protein
MNPEENKFLLKLDLQAHADGDDDVVDDNGSDNQDDNGLSGEDELFKALQSLKDSDDDADDEDDTTDDVDDTDDSDDDSDNDDSDDTDDSDDSDDSDADDVPPEDNKPKDKKKQSKEDNAKFAAERRQKELEAKVQEELQKRLNESPEMKLAKMLADQSGRTPEEMLTAIQEQQLKEEAERRKVPVELLKERQADRQQIERVNQELNQLRYEQWQNKISAEGNRLLGQYKMLTQDDVQSAVDYMLKTVRNVDMPLEDALYAVHGKKIIDSLAQAKQQEDLATKSGRKVPPTPKNGKPSKATKTLSADEKAVAKAFGMSDEEYIKYQS